MCSVLVFLEALYRALSSWEVGFDGADWWKGGASCYTMREEHMDCDENFFEGCILRKCGNEGSSVTMLIERGFSVIMWKGERVIFFDHGS
jgi:hypothetical protein